MRSSMYVLSALLLLAAGCPGDSGPAPRPLDEPEAGRAGSAPAKGGELGGKGGSHAEAGSGEAGKAGAAGKGGAGGSLGGAAGKGGAGGSLGGAAGKGGAGGAAGGAAGSGGAAGASTGSVAGGTKLADITTDAQAAAVCDKVRDQIKRSDFDAIDRGACTLEGLTGELQGAGECTKLTQACLDELGDSSADDTCTADDFPNCPNVTVDEFIACAKANLEVSTGFFGKLSCDTQLQNLAEPETPAACSSLFTKCPELNESTDG